MNIETKYETPLTILILNGRLDAAWADNFLTAAQEQLRKGHHHLRADCAGLTYLSSAGIRSLIRLRRDVTAIDGTFLIRNPSDFVEKTLRLSGLDGLLEFLGVMNQIQPEEKTVESPLCLKELDSIGTHMELHVLDGDARMRLHRPACWTPWHPVRDDDLVLMPCPDSLVSLGIGAPGEGLDDLRSRLGEFVALSGCVSWNSSGSSDMPDFLVQQEQFVPEIHAIQALTAEGTFSHLIRFTPREETVGLPLSELIENALSVTQSSAVLMVVVSEIEGLVGTALCKSPGLMKVGDVPGRYPDILEWLSFCGERIHREKTGITIVFASRLEAMDLMPDLNPMPSRPEILSHVHSLVFPYRPLQEGLIDLSKTVRTLFEGSEPIDILHLIEDNRPLVGIGQSAFLRGACWCAALHDGGGEER